MLATQRTYQNANSRWAGLGPYYAMFPVAFADQVVEAYTQPGETVLDPFAGRGTAIFSAATKNRSAIGIEINPVGYVYARAKLNAASKASVETRLDELGELAERFEAESLDLPCFFHSCFTSKVRQFLLAARSNLDWRKNAVDSTLAALLLVYLHGKMGSALSNQMRQTKSMSPQYAVRWWNERNLSPPDIDPIAFMRSRLRWRYAKGVPKANGGHVFLGDSVEQLANLGKDVEAGQFNKAKLLFTSPPYHAITNYHYDQWLRLWLLGGPPNALRNGNGRGGKFEARKGYRHLIEAVFTKASCLLKEDAIVYVRTDSRDFTLRTTLGVLEQVFPEKHLTEIRRPMLGLSQTRLFGEKNLPAEPAGEVDLVLTPR